MFERRLASGPQGLIVDVPGSAVVNLRVTFHSGFEFSDPEAYEVPHILEHLLATVTRRHSEQNAFIVAAQKNGAYMNASTSAETNEYIYEFAAFELNRILDLLEEQLCEPLFSPAAFEAERSNVREELTRNTTQHMSVCSIRLAAQAAPRLWRDYEQRIGQLDGITLDALEAHHGRTHTARNARFYVAGHFPDGGEVVVARLEAMFERLPRGRRLALRHVVGKGAAAPVVTHRDIDQLYYRSGIYFGELGEHERSTLSLLRMLLVGGMGSRVLGEARRRGLAYGVGAVGYSEPGNSQFGFNGYVTPDHAEALFEAMARHMGELAAGKTTQAELVAAKDLLIGTITRSTQTAADILQWYMDWYDDEEVVRDFDTGLAKLREVDVDDITALSRLIMGAKNRGVSLLGRVSQKQAQTYAAILNLQ
ncbi:MAG TPA: insulinase family protein [Candidatus Saccharimonadia bacterium]|nr:insulinase family protein [Candidatus Saccharimonadia bacterium]